MSFSGSRPREQHLRDDEFAISSLIPSEEDECPSGGASRFVGALPVRLLDDHRDQLDMVCDSGHLRVRERPRFGEKEVETVDRSSRGPLEAVRLDERSLQSRRTSCGRRAALRRSSSVSGRDGLRLAMGRGGVLLHARTPLACVAAEASSRSSPPSGRPCRVSAGYSGGRVDLRLDIDSGRPLVQARAVERPAPVSRSAVSLSFVSDSVTSPERRRSPLRSSPRAASGRPAKSSSSAGDPLFRAAR